MLNKKLPSITAMALNGLRLCIVAAFPLAVAACAIPQTTVYQRQAPFIEDEYLASAKPGTGKLTGQAFTKTRGGDVKYAAGNMVALNPVTTYSTEWFNVWAKQSRVMSEPDQRALKYARTTTADGMGNFEFSGLPAGEYYVVTGIFWEVPGPNGLTTTGTNVGEKVVIKDGEATKVVVH